MTGLIIGAGSAARVLAGPEASPPSPLNDNVPGASQSGFIGLLLRRHQDGYELVLCHAEAGRSMRIETADDDTDIIALWRSIGRKLSLNLLAETESGEIVEMEPGQSAFVSHRRYGSPLLRRRPRFLMRRKPGLPIPHIVHQQDVQTAR